jgi:endonuclease-3
VAAKKPTRRASPKLIERACEINRVLSLAHPDAHCALHHRTPFELLAATILSAQCTDERVNLVAPALFARFSNATEMAAAELDELEELVRTTGFFRNKASNLKGMAVVLVENHGGEVPRTMEELTALPGVGRKTANVVLGNCFGVPGLTIDTHMQRVTKRLGLTKNDTPEKIEQDLMRLLPPEEWTLFSHRIIFHGRRICDARKPKCDICPVAALCDYYAKSQSSKTKRTAGKE